MANEWEEQFASGFCKTQNQTRTVLCEISVDRDGKKVLEETDCEWGSCPHSDTCTLIKGIFE